MGNRKACNIEGCERPHYARGYCNPHWQRWNDHGDPGAPLVRSPLPPSTCSFDGCDRSRSARGLCASHYAQLKRGKELAPLESRGLGREDAWRRLLRVRYGISVQQYDAQLAKQGGGCAICGEVNRSGRRLHVDHDHSCCRSGARSCGKCLRGLLCSACNTGIGQLQESPRLMLLAIEYLTKGQDRA